MFVESNANKDFAPLGATLNAAPNGAEVMRESKFYKYSAPIGATKCSLSKARRNLKRPPFQAASFLINR